MGIVCALTDGTGTAPAWLCWVDCASAAALVGAERAVVAAAFGLRKLKAEVRSPNTARRHGLMFDSCTPKRCSRKRSTEVWSNTCELTQPPALHGDTTNIGTRGPAPYDRPSGLSGEESPVGFGTVKYSYCVVTVELPA